MKKTIATLLALVTLLFPLASCKKEPNTPADTADTTQITDTGRLAELGSRDMGGETFKILDANDYPDMHVNFSTEETRFDSKINEALYNRDIRLTVSYNLGGIEYSSKTKAVSGIDAVRTQTLSGTVDYDMIISTAVGSTALGAQGGTLAAVALQGVLRNLNELQYLSLDKEWWSPLIYKNMLLNDKLFFTTGDIAPSLYQAPAAMYANMDRFLQYYEDTDIFKIVEDGEWTLEKLYTMTVDISQDTNKDNKMHASDDFFGLIIAKNGLTVQNFVIGAGLNFSEVEKNELTMNLKSETLGNVVEKIALLYPSMNFDYKDQQDTINSTFKNGRAVFLAHQLEAAMFHLRDMKDDYVVLPYPKMDASQEQYLSQVNHWCDCFVAVPYAMEESRREFVGFMMEAMAAYSNKELRPLVYETVLKLQRVNDAQSSAMIDVIMDGIVVDYAVVHNIAGLAEMALTAAIDEVPLNVQAMTKRGEIDRAIQEIMTAHGIES